MIKKGIPLVFFDRIPSAELDVPKVLIDDHVKASLMVEHLIEIGRKRIAHIVGPSSIRNAVEREMGYRRILLKHKAFDPDLIVKTTGTSYEDGKKAVKELLLENIQFDAVFAFTDTLAIGAMYHLLENNIAIPQDVSVASFSGTELSGLTYPQLTTVESPLFEMGEHAANLVLEKINDGRSENRTVILKSEIIYRASTVRFEK